MRYRHLIVVLTAVATIFTTGVMAPATFAQDTLEARDFFGTVIAVGETSLTVETRDGDVELEVTQDTRIRLPLVPRALLTDLAEGDVVAVSLEDKDDQRLADKIFLVPGKTMIRHVPGLVEAFSDSELTIRPPGRKR